MAIPTPESLARVGSLSYLYSDACERAYLDYLLLSEEIARYGDVEYDENKNEAERRQEIAGVQAIVFSAMCFEASIYDFSAIHLGDAYVREHLDKLDVLSKWVISLRFVSGYEIDKSRAPYASLKQLVNARNRLVHPKSDAFDFDDLPNKFRKQKQNDESHKKNVHNAYRALVLMSLELDRAIGHKANRLPSFDPQVISSRVVPPRLKCIVDECRAIVGKVR